MDESTEEMHIRVEFRDLTDDQREAILDMRVDDKIVCLVDNEEVEEVGSGYHIPTKTYDIGWVKK